MNSNFGEKIKCKLCSKEFFIREEDKKFYKQMSPKFNNKKYLIPTPKLCPKCRQQRRISFRNDRKLYKNVCDATWKSIISAYSPDKDYKVYSYPEWWSDKWEWLDYWMDFDFSRTFFDQFEDLMKKVPRYSLYNFGNENCDYVQYAPYNKNCYLIFWAMYNEDCFYWGTLFKCKNSVDNFFLFDSQNCYECVYSQNCFSSSYCYDCENIRKCYFNYDCNNCENCIFSFNLRNKKNYIFNKKASKEEIENMKKEIFSSKLKEEEYYKKFFSELDRSAIFKYYHWKSNVNISGNYLYNSKDLFECYLWYDSENISYSVRFKDQKDSYDVTWCLWWSYLLDCSSCDFGYKNMFCLDSERCQECMYVDITHSCKNCFWCVWLKNKEYCILNKQYSKEKYYKLVPKIITNMQKTWEWWELFPSSISPFWYNETIADDYFPLSRTEAISNNFKWKDEEKSEYKWKVYQPLKIEKYDEKKTKEAKTNKEDLLNGVLKCSESGKPFKIIKKELEFYIKNNLSIPNKHYDIRYISRMNLKNNYELFDRKCSNCWTGIKTTYIDQNKKVCCEKCYESLVW